MQQHIQINQYNEWINFIFINYWLESLNTQFYILLENIHVNETIREYDMKYLEKVNIYKFLYNYDQ